MNKLEEKLLELGYVKLNSYIDNCLCCDTFVKQFLVGIRLEIITNDSSFYGDCVCERRYVNQTLISQLQQAYDRLQKDLEVLKKVKFTNEHSMKGGNNK